MKLTIEQAKKLGLNIDDTVYPHFGYRGMRFAPEQKFDVFTETESRLLEALQCLIDCDLHENLTGGCQYQIEMAEYILAELKRG